MEFEIWHIWLIASIVFIVLEIFIPSFVMASVGIGCFFAFLAALVHSPLAAQIIFFIVGTTGGFIGVKPLMEKYAYRRKLIETNAGGLVGRIGKVIEEINEAENSGCVAIDGDQWKSVSSDGSVVPVGEKVKVLSVDSIVLTVEKVGSGNNNQNQATEIPGTTNVDRLAFRLGSKSFFIAIEEIVFVYSTNKITYVVTSEGKQYIHDSSLENLFSELPAGMFFRANRQFIVTRGVISEIKSGKDGKLIASLSVKNGFPNSISVSRLKAAAFREWLKMK